MRYSILDPTGNITALVESMVPVEEQPARAAELMRRHPEIEQVGFVRFPAEGCVSRETTPTVTRTTERVDPLGMRDDPDSLLPTLRMAGGEFCGNATMCAAVLYALRMGLPSGSGESALVRILVSGAIEPVEVELRQRDRDVFDARVHMPQAQEIVDVELSFAGMTDWVPLVRMEGISHLVIEQGLTFSRLRDVPVAAERAACAWCEELGADGLGLMFLSECDSGWNLTPLVYVPASGTIFWEHSCASGSSATGMHCASRQCTPVALTLHEPGGDLRVESDPVTGTTWLSGTVCLGASYGS